MALTKHITAKRTVLAAMALLVFFVPAVILQAVEGGAIDKIRAKDVLNDDDLWTIDRFIAQSIQEIVNGTDFTTVSRIRAGIVSRASATSESSAVQYSKQFTESVHKHLAKGLADAANIESGELKFKVTVNLLILADELGNPRLTDLVVTQIDSKNEAIRYWAVRFMTNPQVLEQLKQSSGNPELAEQVIKRLKKIVDSAGSETLALAAEFAGKIGTAQADELLLQTADMRIKKYADWTVADSIADLAVLGALADRMSDTGSAELCRRFCQLYSYAIQRYIANMKNGRFLSQIQTDQLATLLIETEKSFIGKFTGIQQNTIRRAIEAKDYVMLWAEHNRLLGDESKIGEIPAKLKFDYGNKRIYPLMLPERPAA